MDTKSFYGKQRITHHKFLQDAVSEVEKSGKSVSIAICGPPDGGDDSDIELENDNEMTEVENLPKEIAGEVDVFYESDSDEENNEMASSHPKKFKFDTPKWKKVHLENKKSEVLGNPIHPATELLRKYPYLTNFDEFGIYKEIFGDLIDLLIAETTKYASRDKNDKSFSLPEEDFWNFLGLLLLSGYNIRTSERDYWSKSKTLNSEAFIETMSRNKFLLIKRYLHAADNLNLGQSKMAKVKPLYDLLNKKLQMFGILHHKLSIDESMVPYYGRHSCKQFIKSKPIRFGYKLWMLCSSDGVPYHADIYEGRTDQNEVGPLGSRVVLKLLQVCKNPENHHIFMDNFFTSYDLLVQLKAKNFKATGTVRENRLKHCPLIETKMMKKKERGSYDYRSDGKIEVVKWNDNSVVTLCSNITGVQPINKVKRRVKGKGDTTVTQPAIVKEYNQGMGGVDLLDRSLSDMRPKILGKKWYWVLLVNVLNISTVFAWRIYQMVRGEKMPQKDFRENLVNAMIKKEVPNPMNRPGPSKGIPCSVRTDGVGHYPQAITPRRCVMCKKNAKIQCCKCEKTLHLMLCFQKFHE